ncbi:hypothetical protein [uncultured Brachybacterium sp.]|uniref:hypothetical protein n=1 Tax=uncultured Brachybacterium sp. TaxID=189680 RepID=UPI00262C5502|nr:hypothetical protein [uncultured Brachybacterium sp.]
MFYATITDRILDTIDGMEIAETEPCMQCGCRGMLELTPEQVAALDAGAFIQEAAPEMPAELREQFVSGIHPECWTKLFG